MYVHKKTSNKKCEVCGKELVWGSFAYEQTQCWDCYKRHFQILVSQNIKVANDQRHILHALNVMAEVHGLPRP